MTKKQKKRYKKIFHNIFLIGIDSVVVLGYLKTGGISPLYNNFLVLVHILCWLAVFGQVIASLFFGFFFVLIEKIESGSSDVSFAEDLSVMSLEKKVKMRDDLLSFNTISNRWSHRVFTYFLKPALLLFISIVMGHWSLFIAYGFSWVSGIIMFNVFSKICKKLPEVWKGLDLEEDEAELKKAAMNPISRALVESKEKKKKEEKEKLEERENILDSIMEIED